MTVLVVVEVLWLVTAAVVPVEKEKEDLPEPAVEGKRRSGASSCGGGDGVGGGCWSLLLLLL